jgi:hypothetical protein
VLAVVLALGLLIVGGVALWGALTNRGSTKSTAATPLPSAAVDTKASSQSSAPAPGNAVDNTVVLHCLAAQCPIFVAGPGPTDVQFKGSLGFDERRTFNDQRLIVQVDDASKVAVTINGRPQPKGRPGQSKTYEAPAQQ